MGDTFLQTIVSGRGPRRKEKAQKPSDTNATSGLDWLLCSWESATFLLARQLMEEGHLAITTMVLLEMDHLQKLGRITLPSGMVYDYLHQRMDLKICNKAFVDVIRLASLQIWTRDPFDRIITAHASIDRNLLITKDQTIKDHYK
jgi:PIN domain nuclease of toxin-antitoxin system